MRATWLGFLLAVPCIAALALVGEAAGIGGSQVLVGAGLGLGVGLLQSRVLRGLVDRAAPWILSSVVGLALPFLAIDVATLVGRTIPVSLLAPIGLGGLIAGIWQAALLSRRFRSTAIWVLASAGGWALAGAFALSADGWSRTQSLRGVWGALAYLGMISVGGLVVGLVTGAALAWLVSRAGRVTTVGRYR
jgi:hypothetical protein